MAEDKSSAETLQERAELAAGRLRALRQQAEEALEEQRRRIGAIEEELSSRVQQLADELDADLQIQPAEDQSQRDAELAELRRQIEEDRLKHEKFVEQLAVARRELEALRGAPCAECQTAAQQLDDAKAELDRLRDGLAAAARRHDEDQARHEKFVAQLAAARTAIADLQLNSNDCTALLQAEVEAIRSELAGARTGLDAANHDSDALRGECEHQRKLADEALQKLTQLERREAAWSQEKAELEKRLSDANAVLLDAQSADERQRTELEERVAQADKDRAALGRQLAAATESSTLLQSELAALQQELSSATTELDAAQEKLAEQTALGIGVQSQLEQAKGQLTEVEPQIAAQQQQLVDQAQQLALLQQQIETLEQQLVEQRQQFADLEQATTTLETYDEACRDRDAAFAAAAAHQRQNADLLAGLNDAEAELARLSDAVRLQPSLDELQQKFELALADVQKLKRENAGLREEIARRPAAADEETPELAAARAERDQLAARVAELESQVPAAADPDAQAQFGDLERRFEMAVDDVRQLKRENSELRDKLTKAAAVPGVRGDSPGKLDWAAQKAQLLATLQEEENAGSIDSKRLADRATIEDTIAITDRIVAEKQREIADLQATLEGAYASDRDASQRAKAAEQEQVFSADELIADERRRLAVLKEEWEATQRAAELEFSIERAKLAREQALLKERLLELELTSPSLEGESSDAKPRRRWIDALGLRDDNEKKGK